MGQWGGKGRKGGREGLRETGKVGRKARRKEGKKRDKRKEEMLFFITLRNVKCECKLSWNILCVIDFLGSLVTCTRSILPACTQQPFWWFRALTSYSEQEWSERGSPVGGACGLVKSRRYWGCQLREICPTPYTLWDWSKTAGVHVFSHLGKRVSLESFPSRRGHVHSRHQREQKVSF